MNPTVFQKDPPRECNMCHRKMGHEEFHVGVPEGCLQIALYVYKTNKNEYLVSTPQPAKVLPR